MTPDVRCAATFDPADEHAQCQLYVGHDGDHALLTIHANTRTLLRWTRSMVSHEPFGSDVPAQLPWAPTFPNPVGELRAPAPVTVGPLAPPVFAAASPRRGRAPRLTPLHVVTDDAAASEVREIA